MKPTKTFLYLSASLFIGSSVPSLASTAPDSLKKGVATTIVVASALQGSRQVDKKETTVTNRKGQTFTFDGKGRVSVKDVFGHDLGIHQTNNDHPLPHQSIDFIQQGGQSGVFVGLGLKGGCIKCNNNGCDDPNNCKFASKYGFENGEGFNQYYTQTNNTSSEQVEHNTKPNNQDFDLSKFKELCMDGMDKIKDIKGKDIVLVLGATGSGKSTTCNFLTGIKLVKKKLKKEKKYDTKEASKHDNEFSDFMKSYKGDDYVIDVAADNVNNAAKIGHTKVSETLYPSCYAGPDGWYYCDCPGLLDNRGMEEQFCIALQTKVAIDMAKSVRAICFTITMDELKAARGDVFCNSIISTLQNMFVSPKKFAPSILFLFTKPAESSLDDYKKHLKDFYLSWKDEPKKAKFFELIQQLVSNKDNLISIDPLDESGQTKSEIIKRIKQAKPIPQTAFKFMGDQGLKAKVLNLFMKISVEGLKELNELKRLNREIQRLEESKNILNEKIDHEKVCLERIKKLEDIDTMSEIETFKERDYWDRMVYEAINRIDNRRRDLQRYIREGEKGYITIKEEIKDLENRYNEEYLLHSHCYDEAQLYGTGLKKAHWFSNNDTNTFQFHYSSQYKESYYEIKEKKGCHIKVEFKECEDNSKMFIVKGKTHEQSFGSFRIEYYIKGKYYNESLVKRKKSYLSKLETIIEKDKKEMDDCGIEIEEKKDHKKNMEKMLLLQKKELRKEKAKQEAIEKKALIQKLKNEKIDQEDTIEKKKKSLRYFKQELDKKDNLFKLVIDAYKPLGLQDLSIEEFIQEASEYLGYGKDRELNNQDKKPAPSNGNELPNDIKELLSNVNKNVDDEKKDDNDHEDVLRIEEID